MDENDWSEDEEDEMHDMDLDDMFDYFMEKSDRQDKCCCQFGCDYCLMLDR